jgi:hypothetical protein
MKTCRDQKLDTLVNNFSNFKSCLLHLFVHLWLFCLLRQSITHPHYFGKRGWRGYCHHHEKSWHMCTPCVSLYEVHMGSQRYLKNLDLNCHLFKKKMYYYKFTMVHLPSNCRVIGKQTILSFSLKTIKVFLLVWCKL